MKPIDLFNLFDASKSGPRRLKALATTTQGLFAQTQLELKAIA